MLRSVAIAAALVALLTSAQRAWAQAEPPLPKGGPPADVRFAWPLCGAPTANFGYRVNEETGRINFHAGMDLGDTAGLPVRAAAKGRVVAAENRKPHDLMVEIDHGRGFKTRYRYLDGLRVRPGDIVARGQVLGLVDSSTAQSPHLHFEIWFKNVVRPPLHHLESESTCAGAPASARPAQHLRDDR